MDGLHNIGLEEFMSDFHSYFPKEEDTEYKFRYILEVLIASSLFTSGSVDETKKLKKI